MNTKISAKFNLYTPGIEGHYVVDFNPKFSSKPCIDSIDVFRFTRDKDGDKYTESFHPVVLQVGLENIEKQLSFSGNRLRAVK